MEVLAYILAVAVILAFVRGAFGPSKKDTAVIPVSAKHPEDDKVLLREP